MPGLAHCSARGASAQEYPGVWRAFKFAPVRPGSPKAPRLTRLFPAKVGPKVPEIDDFRTPMIKDLELGADISAMRDPEPGP
jgi:hypothetical protein